MVVVDYMCFGLLISFWNLWRENRCRNEDEVFIYMTKWTCGWPFCLIFGAAVWVLTFFKR